MGRQGSATEADLEFILIDEDAEPKALPFSLLEKITNGFSKENIIGSGTSAQVYKGSIGNRTVAVKKLRVPYTMRETEFNGEIECLMKVKHKNVVRFLGYCSDTQGHAEKYEDKHVMADIPERLLCFEYLPACLRSYIRDASCVLEWRQRYQIIKGVCQGLHQLHEHEILHLDLKPENILLDDDMVPKITDFGISKCLKENQSRVHTKNIHGTLGYMSPERIKHGQITKKCDVYSLGVTIIEIMTGSKYHETIDDVIKSCVEMLDDKQLTDAQKEQIVACAEIGIECSNSEPDKRLSDAKEIIDRLEKAGSTQETLESSKLLKVLPTLLLFDLQPGKLISCSLQLTNDTDEHMLYKLSITENVDWSKHFMKKLPLYGIVQARSTYTVILTVLLEYAPVINRSCYMTLQSCTSSYDYIWKFRDTLECEDFLEVKKTENAVKEVKLKAFLCEEGCSIFKQTRPRVRVLYMEKQRFALYSVDAHPWEPWVITGHDFGHVRIWNHETKRLLYSFELSRGPVYSVKFIARKQWFISSSAEGLIHVYSYETEMGNIKSFRAHGGPMSEMENIKSFRAHGGPMSLAVHPTKPYVLSSPMSGPHEKKLWDWDKGWKCTQTFEREHFARDNFLCQVAFDPETSRFASASDHTVKVWSLGLPKCNYALPGFFKGVNFLDFFTRDDQQYLIIIVSNDMTAKIWDLGKKEYVSNSTRQQIFLSPVDSVFSHPNLPILLTRSTDGTCIWSSKDLRLEGVLDHGYGGIVRGIACLMGSERRFVIGQKRALTILNVDDGKYPDSTEPNKPQLRADHDTSSEDCYKSETENEDQSSDRFDEENTSSSSSEDDVSDGIEYRLYIARMDVNEFIDQSMKNIKRYVHKRFQKVYDDIKTDKANQIRLDWKEEVNK